MVVAGVRPELLVRLDPARRDACQSLRSAATGRRHVVGGPLLRLRKLSTAHPVLKPKTYPYMIRDREPKS